MKVMKLIRDSKFLREDYKLNENLIEFETNKLQTELNQIEDSSVIALVGGYGTGKSTTLYNIQSQDTDQDHRWFQFDAWRYPERKGLWDGLILELAKQIGVERKAARKIDGNKSLIGKWGGIVTELFSQFGDSLPEVEINKINLDPKVTTGAAKISDKVSTIFGKSPAKRAYEMERILADVILSVKEDIIYLIVEDVDRSGTDGIHFLETLNYFIKNNDQLEKSKKKIIVIAPISDRAYEENRESLYKCVDLFMEYSPVIKSSKAFVRQVFTDEALGKLLDDEMLYLDNIESFINALLETKAFQVNVRKIKLIIRHTAQKYMEMSSSLENVDWRAVFVIEALRVAESGPKGFYLLTEVKQSGEIHHGTIFAALLKTIHTPNEHVFEYKYSNERTKENLVLNPRTLSYKFIPYGQQAETSVWEGWERSNDKTRGYIADYYNS